MNATERARRSDSLYYDTQVTNRRALCDMIANLESDLTESKAENAKLRELVRRLISHVEHPPCEGCGFEMNCDGEHVTQCDEWLFMIADARKLGVEVDG